MPLDIRIRTVGVWLCTLLVAVVAQAADFGTKVAYKKDTPVQFGAFSLTFLGERRVASEKFPRGFLYYDFRVTSPQGVQTISWSSGTGDIGPLPFKVGKESFELELQLSDKLGRLKEGEMVVSHLP